MQLGHLPKRYDLIELLGKGGGGEVWRAHDRLVDRDVALKLLRGPGELGAVESLLREATALVGLEGLGLPRVLRFGRSKAGVFLVRELVAGTSLMAAIDAQCSGVTLVAALADVCHQLTAIHRAALLHGDIKSANIIVPEQGPATFIDLGLVAAVSADGSARPTGLTPRYAAPEIWTGAPVTFRAEVFALGRVLEDILERAPGLEDLRAGLERVAARATAEAPEARFPSSDEFAAALEASGIRGATERARAAVFPMVGIEARAKALQDAVLALNPGQGLVVTGRPGIGKSLLLRRVCWTLSLIDSGVAVGWLDVANVRSIEEALSLDLSEAATEKKELILLIDGLGTRPELQRELEDLVRSGVRVVVAGSEQAASLDGETFQLWPVPPLSQSETSLFLRAAMPSLTPVLVETLIERSGGAPGALQGMVARLAGRVIVTSDDIACALDNGGTARPEVSLPAIEDALDRGHFDEARLMLDALAQDFSPRADVARARVLVNAGDAKAAVHVLERAKAGLRDEPLAVQRLWTLHWARASLRLGAYDDAEVSAGKALLAENEIDAVDVEARSVLGLAQAFLDKIPAALESLETARDRAVQLGEARALSVALGSLAFGYQRASRLPDAKRAYEEALTAAERAGDAGTLATTRLNLATIAQGMGDLGQAIEHLEAAVDLGDRSGRVATVRQALLNLANLDLYIGRIARAAESVDRLLGEDLPPQLCAQLTALRAELAHRQGRTEDAAQLCAACAEQYDALGRPADAAEAFLESALMLGEAPSTRSDRLAPLLREAEKRLVKRDAHRARLGLVQALVAARSGDVAGALSRIASLLESSPPEWSWRALAMRAEIHGVAGRDAEARRDRDTAVGFLEQVAERLPGDLREVFWNDSRRRTLRGRSTASESTLLRSSADADRFARILEINRELAGQYDLDRLLERVTDHAIVLLQAERGLVLLRDEVDAPLEVQAARTRVGTARDEYSRSIAERVLRSGEPLVSINARDDERMISYTSVHQLNVQSVACVPIRARSGGVVGALYVETRLQKARHFSSELPLLIAFADQVAVAIETAKLIQTNERRAAELAHANSELVAAKERLAEALGHRTAQLQETRRDLREVRAVMKSHFGYGGIVGTSGPMRRVYALIDRIKDTDIAILIRGESGTGKERVARAIHAAGPRARKPFIGINCGALPEALLEAELFGSVRGAFTGADHTRIGLFREASEGTVLLDEIGEMSARMQASLLRVLQEKMVRPVGGAEEIRIESRVIAATHRDLEAMVQEGTFREDLFYRLNVVEVVVPPLRERLEDIPLLVDHFLGLFAARYGRERKGLTRAAHRLLAAHPWPGNVRQLENTLLNAWVMAEGAELDVADFESLGKRLSAPPPPSEKAARPGPTLSERDSIVRALEACSQNRMRAAEMLGMPRRTLYRRLKEYGLDG